MDHVKLLQQRLAQTERHIAKGKANIDHQRQLINGLRNRGVSVSEASALLKTFEETQALHTADRDRLLNEIAKRKNAPLRQEGTARKA